MYIFNQALQKHCKTLLKTHVVNFWSCLCRYYLFFSKIWILFFVSLTFTLIYCTNFIFPSYKFSPNYPSTSCLENRIELNYCLSVQCWGVEDMIHGCGITDSAQLSPICVAMQWKPLENAYKYSSWLAN